MNGIHVGSVARGLTRANDHRQSSYPMDNKSLTENREYIHREQAVRLFAIRWEFRRPQRVVPLLALAPPFHFFKSPLAARRRSSLRCPTHPVLESKTRALSFAARFRVYLGSIWSESPRPPHTARQRKSEILKHQSPVCTMLARDSWVYFTRLYFHMSITKPHTFHTHIHSSISMWIFTFVNVLWIYLCSSLHINDKVYVHYRRQQVA